MDPADIAAVVDIRANRTDTGNVTGGHDIGAGVIAQGDVAGAGGVTRERGTPDGCVAAPRGVAKERRITVSCVVIGRGVAKES